ncbi:MAG: cupin domain-containing protein [Candidatus Liptonbacteria bacterium]
MPTRKLVLVQKGEIPHITQIAVSRSYDGCDTSRHPHVHKTMWEIYYIVSGSAEFRIGSPSGEQVCEAHPGDLIAVPPDTLHFYRVPEGVELRLLYFGVATD